MISREFKIMIPFAPDTINQVMAYGWNSTTVSALKSKWQKLAEQYLIEAMQKGQMVSRFDFPIKVYFDMFFKEKRTRDEDNYYISSKGIMDAFTSLAMIVDDNNEYVNFGGINFILDKDRPRVEVRVQEVAPFKIDDEFGHNICEHYTEGC